MTTLNSRLRRLIAAVEIKNIRLLQSSATTTVRSLDEVEDTTLNIQVGSKLARRDKDGSFLIHARFAARAGTEGDEPKEAFFTVTATYEVAYLLSPTLQATDEELVEFARANATFNLWGYWREFVHSTAGRMGLPPPILPLFRLGEVRKPTAAPLVSPSDQNDSVTSQKEHTTKAKTRRSGRARKKLRS